MAKQAVCSVSSKISGWNRQIPLVTVQDKSIFRSRLVNQIMYVWQLITSVATRRSHTARSCSKGLVQSRRGWYTYGSSLAWHAPGNHVLDAPWWHWYLCPTGYSYLNLDFEKCYVKKGRGMKSRILRKCLCTRPRHFHPLHHKGPYQRKLSSITGCDDISAFFGKGKWKAVPLT